MFLKHARRKIFRNGVKTNVTFFFSLPNKWQTFLYLARLITCASPPLSLPTSLQMSFVAFPWRLASYGNIRSWKIKDMVGIKEVWRMSPAPKQDPEGLEIHSSVNRETGFGSSAGSCMQGGGHALSILQLDQGSLSFNSIHLLSLGETIGPALSRCSGNACGMKKGSGMCLAHSRFTMGRVQY